jgi:hypothetical protein
LLNFWAVNGHKVPDQIGNNVTNLQEDLSEGYEEVPATGEEEDSHDRLSGGETGTGVLPI